MNIFDKLAGRLSVPKLTRGRVAAAMTIAFTADLLQLALFPVAWTFAQSAVDVVAMLLVMWAIGFHLLLLPTFATEFIPGVNMLPTWTACVIAVVALRKREQGDPPSQAMDVESTVRHAPPQIPPPTGADSPPEKQSPG